MWSSAGEIPCFWDVMIQQIFWSPILRQELLQINSSCSSENEKRSFVFELQKMLLYLQEGSGGYYDIRPFVVKFVDAMEWKKKNAEKKADPYNVMKRDLPFLHLTLSCGIGGDRDPFFHFLELLIGVDEKVCMKNK